MNNECVSLGFALRALKRVDKTAKKLEDLVKYVNYFRRKHNFLVFYTAGVVFIGGMAITKLKNRIDILEKKLESGKGE